MHKSRQVGFIIDCKVDLSRSPYVGLKMPADEPYMEVQKVDHESRVHLDIETDDIDAEVARLEKLGAKKVAKIKKWVVLEAPTGHRFCVVPVDSKDFATKAHTWNEDE